LKWGARGGSGAHKKTIQAPTAYLELLYMVKGTAQGHIPLKYRLAATSQLERHTIGPKAGPCQAYYKVAAQR